MLIAFSPSNRTAQDTISQANYVSRFEFPVTYSMQNYEIQSSTDGVSRYIVKYIVDLSDIVKSPPVT